MILDIFFGYLIRPTNQGEVVWYQLEKLILFSVNRLIAPTELENVPLAEQQSKVVRRKRGITPYNMRMCCFSDLKKNAYWLKTEAMWEMSNRLFHIKVSGLAGFFYVWFWFFFSYYVFMESVLVNNLGIFKIQIFKFQLRIQQRNLWFFIQASLAFSPTYLCLKWAEAF